MNFQVLSGVVDELATLIIGARVDRVYQGQGGGLYLLLGSEGGKYILLLSPDRAQPRLHLVSAKPVAEDSPHGFILYLRSHVSGARVTGVGLLNRDRIVEIRFRRQEKEQRLLFELFGSAANLVFVDAASKILAVYYPVAPAEQVSRPLLPGLLYTLPDKPRGSGSGQSVLSLETGENSSPNRTCELYYEQFLERQQVVALRASLSALVKKKLSKTRRLKDALSGDIQSVEQAEHYRQQGELILANLSTLRNGMESADLTGYDGTAHTVTLDPKRSPSRNAELYFKKYKKAKTGRKILEARLQQVTEETAHLESLLSRLDRIVDAGELALVQSELKGKVAAGPKRTAGEKMQPSPPSSSIRTILYNGWEILVGKSAAANDQLTMKIARPDDLWFHAEGTPGSHVLIKNPKAGDIPPDVVTKAAALAAFYSKGRNAGKVSVTYTRAGLVRKPKGAKPGLVILRERKSLMVKPEEG